MVPIRPRCEWTNDIEASFQLCSACCGLGRIRADIAVPKDLVVEEKKVGLATESAYWPASPNRLSIPQVVSDWDRIKRLPLAPTAS